MPLNWYGIRSTAWLLITESRTHLRDCLQQVLLECIARSLKDFGFRMLQALFVITSNTSGSEHLLAVEEVEEVPMIIGDACSSLRQCVWGEPSFRLSDRSYTQYRRRGCLELTYLL